MCRLTGATLVIAKLDRRSRDAAFLLNLEKSGVEFIAADMPNANRLTVRVMAVIAQEERELISASTKAALGAVKARGKRLDGWRATLRDGRPNEHVIDNRLGTEVLRRRADAFVAGVGPMVAEMRRAGRSHREIAAELVENGIRTPRGGQWTAAAVRAMLARVTHSYCADRTHYG